MVCWAALSHTKGNLELCKVHRRQVVKMHNYHTVAIIMPDFSLQSFSCNSERFQAKYLTSFQIACKIARNCVILNRFLVYL